MDGFDKNSGKPCVSCCFCLMKTKLATVRSYFHRGREKLKEAPKENEQQSSYVIEGDTRILKKRAPSYCISEHKNL